MRSPDADGNSSGIVAHPHARPVAATATRWPTHARLPGGSAAARTCVLAGHGGWRLGSSLLGQETGLRPGRPGQAVYSTLGPHRRFTTCERDAMEVGVEQSSVHGWSYAGLWGHGGSRCRAEQRLETRKKVDGRGMTSGSHAS